MPESAAVSRWLLVLGSNANARSVLAQARVALNALGEIVGSSRTVEGADVGGGEQPYLNQLVELQMDADVDAVRAATKLIEGQHGRSPQRMANGICDLDIDVVALLDGKHVKTWLADKPRQIPAVQQLLSERFGAETQTLESLGTDSREASANDPLSTQLAKI